MRISSFLVGLLLVLAGLIALLNNLGLGTIDLVRQAYRFWPIILIVVGISLFWNGKIPSWLALLLVLFVSAGVIFVGLTSPRYDYGEIRTDVSVRRIEHPDLKEGELKAQFGGGRLTINPTRDSWFEGTFSGSQRVVPSHGVEQSRLTVKLQQRGTLINLGGGTSHWDVKLSPDIPWRISLDVGAIDGRLNVLGIPLENLDLKFGAGDITLDLGDNGEDARVVISSGASNLKVRVPEDIGLQIEVKGALARTNLQEHKFPIFDEQYTSPNYEEADSRISMRIDMAVGNFELEQYAR